MTKTVTKSKRKLDVVDRIAACIDPEAFSGEVDEMFQRASKAGGPTYETMTWMPRIADARVKAAAVLAEIDLIEEPLPVPVPSPVLDRYDAMIAPLGIPSALADNPGTGFGHLRWMLSDLRNPKEPGKAGRWLGFVQGILIDRSFTTVQIERDFTRPFFNPKRIKSPRLFK